MPDSNPLYDLVGGYYPGEPLPRRRPNYTRPTPVEFNPDAFIDEYMAEVKKEVEKVSVSKQAKKLFIDDVERALVVQVQPKKASYDPMRALELGDEEDVAGAQIKLDVNPVKWVKNPKEMVKETATNWVKDMANWDDFDSYMEREQLWKPLLRGDSENPIINYVYGTNLKEGAEVEIQPFQVIGTGTEKINKVELLDKDGDFENVVVGTDMIKKTGQSYQEFVKKRRSSGSRNGAFDSHVLSSANATAFELKQLVENGVIKDDATKEIIEDYTQRARILRAANKITSKFDTDIYLFGDEAKLDSNTINKMKDRGELYGQGIGFALGEVADKVELVALDKRNIGDAVGAWSKMFEDTIGDDGAIKKMGGLSVAKKMLSEADDHFLNNRGLASFEQFKKETQPFRNLIGELEKFRDDTRGTIETLEKYSNLQKRLAKELSNKGLTQQQIQQRIAEEIKLTAGEKLKMRDILGQLDYISEKYSREGPIKGGLQNMNRMFVENHMLTGPVSDVIFKNENVIGSKSVLNITEEALHNYKREDWLDLANKLEKDGLLGVIADKNWNLVRKRLDGNTPAATLNEYLTRRHYFGLKYDPNYGPGGEYEANGSAFWNSVISEAKMFENRHSVNIGGIGKFNFIGNENLSLAFNLYERTQEDPTDAIFLDKDGFLSLINGLSDDKAAKALGIEEGPKYSVMFAYGFFGKDEDGNRLILQRAAGLRKWLKEHNDQLGLEWDGDKLVQSQANYDILQKLFKTLSKEQGNPTLISFTQRFATPLEKFSQFSNKLQSSVFSFAGKIVGKSKILTAALQAQNLISRAGRKFIKDVLVKIAKKIFGAAVGATTGIGVLIMPIINRLTQLITKKIQDLIKNIRKKGIGAIEDMMEEGFQSLAKTSSYIVGGFSLGCLVPSLLVATVMLGAITPVDTTKMTPGMAIGPGGILEGDCDWSESETTGLSSSDPIVSAAIEIADPLEKGYWCLWNKQTQDYPNYWNEYKFRSNPFPSATFDCYDCLFWCTRLVIYSHREAGYNFRNIVNSQKQKNYMARRHEYFKRDEINASDLQPGDVVFFQTPRVDRINHVAIVSDVGSDTVETIHSNAWVKVLDLTVDVGSGKVQDYNDMKVIGFGRWKR